MEAITDIAQWCGSNPAAVLQLSLIRASEVVEIHPHEAQVVPDIDLELGASWVTWIYSPESCSFKETDKYGNDGHGFEYELAFDIPTTRPEVQDLIMRMKDDTYILIYLDQHGQYRIIGEVGNGARFVADDLVDAKGNGRNGYKVAFRGLSSHKAYFYDGTPGGSPLPGGGVDGGGMLLLSGGVLDGEFQLSGGDLIYTGTDITFSIDSQGQLTV